MFVLAGPSVLASPPPPVEVAEGPTLRSQKRKDVEGATPRRGSRKCVKLIVSTPTSRKKGQPTPAPRSSQPEPSPSKGKGKSSSSLGSKADEARDVLVYPSIMDTPSIPNPLPPTILAILRNSYSLTKNPDFSSTGLSLQDWNSLFSQLPPCEQCGPSDNCVYSSSDFFCSPCRSRFPTSRKACSFKNIMRFMQFHQQAKLPPVVAREIVRRRQGADFLASSAISDSQWSAYSSRLIQLSFFRSRPQDLGLSPSDHLTSPARAPSASLVDTSKPNTPIPRRIRRVFKVSNPPDEDDSPLFHAQPLTTPAPSSHSQLPVVTEHEVSFVPSPRAVADSEIVPIAPTRVSERSGGSFSSVRSSWTERNKSLRSVSTQTVQEAREVSHVEEEIVRLYRSLELSFPDEDIETLSDRMVEKALKALENDLVSPHPIA